MFQSKNIFTLLESVIEEQIPECLVYILTAAGYASQGALKRITSSSVTRIEQYFNSNFERLSSGLCGSSYEHMKPFQILPGHRAIIESFPQYMEQVKTVKAMPVQHSTIFSCILKLLVETAENNHGREPKGRRYDDSLTFFATYIYLICGRACYETLSANLPWPQASTICKYIFDVFACYYV